jgi:hypothetical protein
VAVANSARRTARRCRPCCFRPGRWMTWITYNVSRPITAARVACLPRVREHGQARRQLVLMPSAVGWGAAFLPSGPYRAASHGSVRAMSVIRLMLAAAARASAQLNVGAVVRAATTAVASRAIMTGPASMASLVRW